MEVDDVENPELHNWIVTYDPHGMPGSIQGTISGKSLNVPDIFSLDLSSMTVKDRRGNTYILVGPGLQAVFLTQIEPFKFIKMVDEDEYDPDDENN